MAGTADRTTTCPVRRSNGLMNALHVITIIFVVFVPYGCSSHLGSV